MRGKSSLVKPACAFRPTCRCASRNRRSQRFQDQQRSQYPIRKRIQAAILISSNDGDTGRHCFQKNDPESFPIAWHHEHVREPKIVRHLFEIWHRIEVGVAAQNIGCELISTIDHALGSANTALRLDDELVASNKPVMFTPLHNDGGGIGALG